MDDDLEIRTFATSEEIRKLPGYKPNNPINSKNYDNIVGDYWLRDMEQCCFHKTNGELCNTKHKWGFVARLTDKSVTIVGNCCAMKKFGVDSKMKADSRLYSNEKKRREAFENLQELLVSKVEFSATLESVIVEVRDLKGLVDDFTFQLSDGVLRKMKDMFQTGSFKVTVQGISIHEFTEEDGYKKTERTITDHSIGRLDGLKCLINSTFSSIVKSARSALDALEKAETLEGSASLREIKSVASDIGGNVRVEKLVADLRDSVDAFLKNDYFLLCFLTTDKLDRYKYAQLTLQQRGQDSGKSKAKFWLAEQEKELAKLLSVSKVAVQ